MAGAYRSVGYAFSAGVGVPQPAVLLEVGIKLLQIVLRQLAEGDVTDVRDDVAVDRVLISRLCTFSQGRLAEALIPVIDPFAEGHFGLNSLCYLAKLFFECFELFLALALCVGEYAFGLGIAFLVIAYNDPAFPASVRAKAYRAFALLSLIVRH